jgi:hypothetical protein
MRRFRNGEDTGYLPLTESRVMRECSLNRVCNGQAFRGELQYRTTTRMVKPRKLLAELVERLREKLDPRMASGSREKLAGRGDLANLDRLTEGVDME